MRTFHFRKEPFVRESLSLSFLSLRSGGGGDDLSVLRVLWWSPSIFLRTRLFPTTNLSMLREGRGEKASPPPPPSWQSPWVAPRVVSAPDGSKHTWARVVTPGVGKSLLIQGREHFLGVQGRESIFPPGEGTEGELFGAKLTISEGSRISKEKY